YTAAPVLFRVLWDAGHTLPPPAFLGVLPHAALLGGVFYAVMEPSFWLLTWLFGVELWQVGVWPLLLCPAGGAIGFGLTLAEIRRWQAARLGLPPWESSPAQATTETQPSVKSSVANQ